jgi:hypothetical protein
MDESENAEERPMDLEHPSISETKRLRKYWLGRPIDGLERSVPIGLEFFDEIKLALKGSAALRSIEEDFDVLLGNYLELDAYLLTIASAIRLGRRTDRDVDDYRRRNAQRWVSNILTSARAFIDHSLRTSSSLLGSASPGHSSVKSAFSTQYDSVRGYRFLEAVRNHAQHAGVSVDSLTYLHGPYPTPEGQESPAFGVEPTLSLRHLEDDPGFKKAILAEMAEGAEQGLLVLSGHIREYIFGLYQALVQVRSTLEPVRLRSLSALGDAIDRFVGGAGAFNHTGATAFATDETSVVEVHHLSSVDLDRVLALRHTNVVRADFVSSRVIG